MPTTDPGVCIILLGFNGAQDGTVLDHSNANCSMQRTWTGSHPPACQGIMLDTGLCSWVPFANAPSCMAWYVCPRCAVWMWTSTALQQGPFWPCSANVPKLAIPKIPTCATIKRSELTPIACRTHTSSWQSTCLPGMAGSSGANAGTYFYGRLRSP